MSSRIFDTGTEDLRTEISEGVMTITLNRPERRNALSDAMLEGLIASLADAETAVHSLVVYRRVPVRVNNDDAIAAHQIQPNTANLSRQQ